jgi:hypothetical protein
MPGEKPKQLREALAVAVAGGRDVGEWAREAGVSRRTANRWAATPGFKARVAELRRRLTDRAIGRLTATVTAAADELARLATGAASEQVRLQASRAILADMISVTEFAELTRRMTEVERKLNDRCTGETTHAG